MSTSLSSATTNGRPSLAMRWSSAMGMAPHPIANRVLASTCGGFKWKPFRRPGAAEPSVRCRAHHRPIAIIVSSSLNFELLATRTARLETPPIPDVGLFEVDVAGAGDGDAVYAQMLLKVCRRKVGIIRLSLPMERRRKAHPSARMRLAQHLRSERAARGLSQEQLADLAGLHRTYVGSVERAERNVSLDNIERLADALGLDIASLLRST